MNVSASSLDENYEIESLWNFGTHLNPNLDDELLLHLHKLLIALLQFSNSFEVTEDPNRFTESPIEQLPVVTISKKHIERQIECIVCIDYFLVGDEAKRLPCHHLYHEKCITLWLKEQAICPACRKLVATK